MTDKRTCSGSDRAPGLLDTAGRVTGFLLLAVPSMAVLAAMVLLPAYRNLQQQRYELARLEVVKQEKEDLANTRDRLIHRLPNDESLTLQLVIAQTNLTPADAEVVADPSKPPRNPLRITIPRRPLPPPPDDRWLALGHTIEQPQIRAGLALIAAAGLIGSLFMFSPVRPSNGGAGTRRRGNAERTQGSR